MHQYLDSDGSGTSGTCVSSTIGSERLADATDWLRSNGKKGLIGEFAGGVNDVCEAAVKDMLAFLDDNSDVWEGKKEPHCSLREVANLDRRALVGCWTLVV